MRCGCRAYPILQLPLNLPLFHLYLRRAMHPVLGLVLLAAAGLVIRGAAAPATALLGAEDPEQLARGLLRHDLWFLLCAVLLPVQLLAAGRWASRVRSGEASWLLPRSLSGDRIVVTTWLALLAGGVAWLIAIGAAGELATGAAGDSQRLIGEWRLHDDRARSESETLRWEAELGELPAGSRGRLHLGILGDFRSVGELVLHAERIEGEPLSREGRTPPTRRGRIEVELPEGAGDLRFELEVIHVSRPPPSLADLHLGAPLFAQGRAWPAAFCTQLALALAQHELEHVAAPEPLILDGLRFEVSVPARERAGTAALLLQLALALAAWLALALGLGAWISAPSATLLIGVTWGGLWLEGIGGAFVPGAALPRVFAAVAEGRVPASLPAGVWGGTAVLVVVGLALAGAGLRWGGRST